MNFLEVHIICMSYIFWFLGFCHLGPRNSIGMLLKIRCIDLFFLFSKYLNGEANLVKVFAIFSKIAMQIRKFHSLVEASSSV